MKRKEEDDLEICDMDVDKSFDETVTEISENDVSQDSQVLLANTSKTLSYLVLFVGVLCYRAKCVLDATTNTRCVHNKICYSNVI